jgi:hypothetical protein
MLALILIAAALISLIAAFFFRPVPTDQELEDNEKVKELLWLPSGIVMLIAAFYAIKRTGEGPPKPTMFIVLLTVCVAFMIAGLVALVGFGNSGAPK